MAKTKEGTVKKRSAPAMVKPSKASKVKPARACVPTEDDYEKSLEYGVQDEDRLNIVSFMLGLDLYGVEIDYAEEVIKPREAATLPHMPEFITGVISLRGEMVIIMNLKMRLGLTPGDSALSRIVVVELGELKVGLMVDKMIGIMEIPRIIAGSGSAEQRFIKGVSETTGRRVSLFDMEKLLDFVCPIVSFNTLKREA